MVHTLDQYQSLELINHNHKLLVRRITETLHLIMEHNADFKELKRFIHQLSVSIRCRCDIDPDFDFRVLQPIFDTILCANQEQPQVMPRQVDGYHHAFQMIEAAVDDELEDDKSEEIEVEV